jgi:hypothetical protein
MTRHFEQPVLGFQNAKTVKGESLGYVTAIRYLAPADESGMYDVCPNAGACRSVCLYTAGRGEFAQVKEARIWKTYARFADLPAHLAQAKREIIAAERKARAAGLTLVVRMNGTSDLPGDAIALAYQLPGVQFYDYTKLHGLLLRDLPANYHLTLSYDPQTVPWDICEHALTAGYNVAVAFNVRRNGDLPETWNGVRVIDGDDHDLRFLDPKGVIVGLRAKGAARGGASEFVVTP